MACERIGGRATPRRRDDRERGDPSGLGRRAGRNTHVRREAVLVLLAHGALDGGGAGALGHRGGGHHAGGRLSRAFGAGNGGDARARAAGRRGRAKRRGGSDERGRGRHGVSGRTEGRGTCGEGRRLSDRARPGASWIKNHPSAPRTEAPGSHTPRMVGLREDPLDSRIHRLFRPNVFSGKPGGDVMFFERENSLLARPFSLRSE